MIHIRSIVLLTATVLLLAPAASAGSAPALGFLADGETGPVGDGVMVQAWPDSNESKVRTIAPELLGATSFVDADERPGTHLRGPLFAGIWPDAGIAKDSELRLQLLLDGEVIAEGTAPVNLDPNDAPDPMMFIPPDPTDPEGAVYYELAQVMPILLKPPTVVDLGYINVEIPNGSTLKLAMALTSGEPVPTAATMALKYDGLLSPSFLYLPWWSADPAAESPQIKQMRDPVDPDPYQNGDPTAGAGSRDDAPAAMPEDEDSPGFALIMVLASVGVALLARRRF